MFTLELPNHHKIVVSQLIYDTPSIVLYHSYSVCKWIKAFHLKSRLSSCLNKVMRFVLDEFQFLDKQFNLDILINLQLHNT